MTVTAITCTGGRPEAFELCQKYMGAQTVKPDQWIVMHDGITQKQVKELQAQYSDIELYAGPRLGKPGLNTYRFSMEEALKHVRGDYILFIEDDDSFAPTYIEEMVKLLQTVDMAGLSHNKYYNLALPGWMILNNTKHSSLCSTAIRKSVLPLFQDAVDSGDMYFDIQLWNHPKAKELKTALIGNSNLCIGIKGMPGRTGFSTGHRIPGYSMDPTLAKLKEWIGDEATQIYKPFIKKYVEAPTLPATKKTIKAPTIPVKSVLVRTKPAVNVQPTVNAKVPPMQKVYTTAKGTVPNQPNLVPAQNLPTSAASDSQKKAMALMPQSPGSDPAKTEIIQTVPTYPSGERGQGDIFK